MSTQFKGLKETRDFSFGSKVKFRRNYPSKYYEDPDEVMRIYAPEINALVPLFARGNVYPTGSMIATVLRITGLVANANQDDVAVVLKNLNANINFRNGKFFFDLDTLDLSQNKARGSK